MILIAIETSCDESGICVIKDNRILSNLVYSQIDSHKKYGGVVPEIASREHSDKIAKLIIDSNIKKADYVGFTRGPGLKGSLLIGKIAAMTISNYFDAKLIGINHLEGHLLSVEINDDKIEKKLKFPLIALIISGGHSELWYVENYGKYSVMGSTRDDAVGEAFDKVAKILNLGYPGGPAIEKIASKSLRRNKIFSVPEVKDSFDYSFSGIKTQVAYYVRDNKVTLSKKKDICYSFQDSVSKSLIKKLKLAVEKYRVNNIVVCGGVIANSYIRNMIMETFPLNKFNVFLPQKNYSSDNAAMIGVSMLRAIEHNYEDESIEIEPDLKAGSNSEI